MFDVENTPPIPFDKVLEGRSISAKNSPLFKLPFEIIHNIGSQLPLTTIDLASLALVNTDCRQLARSWQFREIRLDDSLTSQNLLTLLQQEAAERSRNNHRTRSLSLGACIRHVVVTNRISWKKVNTPEIFDSGKIIKDKFDDSFDDDEQRITQRRSIVDEIEMRLNENNHPDIMFVIASLIHLESLEIYEIEWDQKFLKKLASLPIKYFYLCNTLVSDQSPIMDILEWPLEILTIYLDWSSDYDNSGSRSVNAFNAWEVVLRSCAPFLRELLLRQSLKCGEEFTEEFIPVVFEFPKLRQLDLWGSSYSSSALQSLITTSCYLTNLSVNYGNPNHRDFLDRLGHIESLKTLILDRDCDEDLDDASFDFLKMNSQLEEFCLSSRESHTVLEKILRLLRKFVHLKMLSLNWEGSNFPESSLAELASLSQIENLHLSLESRHRSWPICHQTIPESLRSLRRLKRLEITQYNCGCNLNEILARYSNELRYLNPFKSDFHYDSMFQKALIYADKFPELELLKIGGVTYEVLRPQSNLKLKVIHEGR